MARKPKSIKIGDVEIKDHRTVSFTMAFIITLIAFTAGVLAYHYIFMVLPQKPGCVQVSVKNTGGQAVHDAKVEIYIAIYGGTGEKVAEALTDMGGKVRFCDKFEPNKEYVIYVYDSTGNKLWEGLFATNERSTADFPIIVRQEY